MPNWVHTNVIFAGTPDDFLFAVAAREKTFELPIRVVRLEFERDGVMTTASFDSAHVTDIWTALALSCLLPDLPVDICWAEFGNMDVGNATILAGRMTELDHRHGDEIRRWSKASGLMRIFEVVYDDPHDASRCFLTGRLIREDRCELLTIEGVPEAQQPATSDTGMCPPICE